MKKYYLYDNQVKNQLLRIENLKTKLKNNSKFHIFFIFIK